MKDLLSLLSTRYGEQILRFAQDDNLKLSALTSNKSSRRSRANREEHQPRPAARPVAWYTRVAWFPVGAMPELPTHLAARIRAALTPPHRAPVHQAPLQP